MMMVLLRSPAATVWATFKVCATGLVTEWVMKYDSRAAHSKATADSTISSQRVLRQVSCALVTIAAPMAVQAAIARFTAAFSAILCRYTLLFRP